MTDKGPWRDESELYDELMKEINLTRRPAEKRNDFWLGNSPSRENVALFIGHLVIDLMRKNPNYEISFKNPDEFGARECLQVETVYADTHVRQNIKYKELELYTHPRAKAQHTSDDMHGAAERVKRGHQQ